MSNITFELQEANNNFNNDDKVYYPVVASNNKFSTEQLCRDIQQCCTATEADILAVMSAMAKVVGNELARGMRVEIPNLGTLSPILTCNGNITNPNDKQIARNMRVRTIGFTPKSSLMQSFSQVQFRRSDTVVRRCTPLTKEQIIERLQCFFETQPSAQLTRRTFSQITGYRRTKANATLRLLTEEGVLVRQGQANAPYYTLAMVSK